jgi:hypothetical protein
MMTAGMLRDGAGMVRLFSPCDGVVIDKMNVITLFSVDVRNNIT